MGFQGSLVALAKTFILFYIGCCLIGRPDIVFKAVGGLRAKALAGTSASWGCPSPFHRNACKEYNPNGYR